MSTIYKTIKSHINYEQVVLASLALIILTPLLFDVQGYAKFRVPKYLYFSFILIGISAIPFLLRNQIKQVRYNQFSIVFSLFIGSIVITQFVAYDPLMSLYSTFNRLEGLWYYVSLFLFFLIGSSVSIHNDKWRLIFYGWVAIAILITLGGILFDKGYVSHYRLASTLGNPSHLANYLISSIALLFLFIEDSPLAKRYYYLFITAILILLAGIFLTFARTTYVGLVIGFIIYILLRRKEFFRFSNRIPYNRLVVFAGLLLTGCLLAFNYHKRIFNLYTFSDRVRIWKIALAGIRERPLLGWGSDNFVYVYDKYQQGSDHTAALLYDRSHNLFLDWFVNGGVVGGACYSLLWLVLLWSIWKTTLSNHQKAVLTSWWSVSVIYLFLNIDNLSSWLLLILVALYTLNNLPATQLSLIKHRRLITSLYFCVGIYGLCLLPLSVKRIAQSYFVTRPFTTADFERKSHILESLSENNSPATFSMSTAISDYGFDVLHSDLPQEQKTRYTNLAVAIIESEIKKRPPSVHLLNIMADFYIGLKRTDSAVDIYKRISQINPANQLPYFQLGHLYFTLKQYREAYVYFDKAEKRAPSLVEASIMKIRVKALTDSTYNYEADLLKLPADGLIKNAHMVGNIFRDTKKYTNYLYWIWRGGYHSKDGLPPTVLYEFATTAYTAGNMETLKQVLTMYKDSYGCSPAFATDVLALVDKGIDPSAKLLSYKSYCK